jgi:hypothetical protein
MPRDQHALCWRVPRAALAVCGPPAPRDRGKRACADEIGTCGIRAGEPTSPAAGPPPPSVSSTDRFLTHLRRKDTVGDRPTEWRRLTGNIGVELDFDHPILAAPEIVVPEMLF